MVLVDPIDGLPKQPSSLIIVAKRLDVTVDLMPVGQPDELPVFQVIVLFFELLFKLLVSKFQIVDSLVKSIVVAQIFVLATFEFHAIDHHFCRLVDIPKHFDGCVFK